MGNALRFAATTPAGLFPRLLQIDLVVWLNRARVGRGAGSECTRPENIVQLSLLAGQIQTLAAAQCLPQ